LDPANPERLNFWLPANLPYEKRFLTLKSKDWKGMQIIIHINS
jgi:hypothetical protein